MLQRLHTTPDWRRKLPAGSAPSTAESLREIGPEDVQGLLQCPSRALEGAVEGPIGRPLSPRGGPPLLLLQLFHHHLKAELK